jgi:hypothetical protein
MNRQRTLLQEYTSDPKSIKEARSTPIPEPEVDRSLSFLRAIVLDLPIQTGGVVESKQEIAPEIISKLDEEQVAMLRKLAGLK